MVALMVMLCRYPLQQHRVQVPNPLLTRADAQPAARERRVCPTMRHLLPASPDQITPLQCGARSVSLQLHRSFPAHRARESRSANFSDVRSQWACL